MPTSLSVSTTSFSGLLEGREGDSVYSFIKYLLLEDNPTPAFGDSCMCLEGTPFSASNLEGYGCWAHLVWRVIPGSRETAAVETRLSLLSLRLGGLREVAEAK